MSEIIGVYSLDDSFSEHMSLTLYPDSFPVRWSLCNLTANFMAEYFGELFPDADSDDRMLSRDEISGAVGYVLNELVENAVKFNLNGEITVTVGLGREDLVCLVSNQIPNVSVPGLRQKLLELTQEDPGELLRRQAEANFEDAENTGSGLGYLIIMNDYGVSLGWKLDPITSSSFILKTMARIPILNERSRMEIKGGNYRVWYDANEVTVYFEGILRLGGPQEYAPIETLLDKVLESNPSKITLDLRALNFLNSSGINVLYKFAIATRKKGELQLLVRGSKNVPWQGKSLPNLKKFNQNFELTLVD
ncbi:slr1658 superfamily regulator [Chondromyces apiculatus]|uniref:STAS domain-containing protein n=1 Tax=Chondromyces apiculatus DSM 436 TaxID=1192034 RepID=A0A017SXU1_9BACT|nr:hypothetical protein [Chondromyces apiculatus]EYF01547.1 Hypothetical protein CAP_7987 [Chondromyces apiculatus DSM 436]